MADNSTSQERISRKLSPNTETESKKKAIIALACIFVLFVVAVLVAIALAAPNRREVVRNEVVTPENVDEIIAELPERTPPGEYEVKMNTTWVFETGESASSNAYVENSKANTNAVYFDIIRSDTEETIYQSPTLPVGSHLEGITLDTALEAGSYPCMLTYYLLDDEGEPISKLNINLDITVTR